MKLYHFICEKYGLESIKYQRIKVSSLDNLNDPFELYAAKLTNHKHKSNFGLLKQHIVDSIGILCLSSQWNSPLLWSHYADRHKGVALEVEVTDNRVKNITYQNKRLEPEKLDFLSLLTDMELVQNKLLTTKYSQWSYEQESRIFFSKPELVNIQNLSFFKFNSECKLTGIITGPLSQLDEGTIKSVLPKGKSIKLIKSRLAYESYNVVRNKMFSPRIITNE